MEKRKPSWWDNIPVEFKLERAYHTTWQSKSGMRFRLLGIDGETVTLGTFGSKKTFTCAKSDLRDTNTHKVKL